jgi:uncharacterized repeat protein (TIGR03803 family)
MKFTAWILIRRLLLIAALATAAHAQFSVMYNFGSKIGDPANPSFSGIVAQGRNGSLYGTTPSGGANGAGAVFKITPTGILTLLYSFTGGIDGANPSSGLTLGTDGSFYGTTVDGGVNFDGTVFKISANGILTVLHSFNCTDGCNPVAGVIQGADGNFYGTTFAADGTVFKITPTGVFTTLHSFKFFDGSGPNAMLIQSTDGSFYGTTDSGGMFGFGTVFKMSAGGTFKMLHNFTCGTDGCVPVAGLVQGTNGSFYGTTREGGANNDGTVFKITSIGTLTTLHDFAGSDGAAPFGGLVLATDGNYYGTTSSGGTHNDGTIFRISPTGDYSVLHNFDGTSGSTPYVSVLQHTNGVLYGDTLQGGTGNVSPCTAGSCGVFYQLEASLPTFVSLLSNSGKVGKSVEFLGQGFTAATTVSFNGTPATPSVNSSAFLTATVPSGATTGFVTVTTSRGTLSSKRLFRVIPQITGFSPTSGTVGALVTITGVSLKQTTRVTFGGVKASFTVNSDTKVTATVPSGVAAGKIAMTTPGGTATSSGTFTVSTTQAGHCEYVCGSTRCGALTGNCVGSVGGSCQKRLDSLHCPIGQPAKNPVTRCGVGVDLDRACTDAQLQRAQERSVDRTQGLWLPIQGNRDTIKRSLFIRLLAQPNNTPRGLRRIKARQ